MGRGRAKAKQTKIAREIKYSTVETDLERLQRELASASPSTSVEEAEDDDEWDPDAAED